jgi:hypothetical protein
VLRRALRELAVSNAKTDTDRPTSSHQLSSLSEDRRS